MQRSIPILAILLATAVTATAGSAADMPKGALCALVDIQECDAGAACEKVTAEDIAVPRFIRVEIGKRTLQGVGPRARDRITKIRSVDQRGDVVFASGVDDQIEGQRPALAWILALDAQDGSMQLTVTGQDTSFIASGECVMDK